MIFKARTFSPLDVRQTRPVDDAIKLFFGGNLDFPIAETARIGHDKSNKHFWSIVFLKIALL